MLASMSEVGDPATKWSICSASVSARSANPSGSKYFQIYWWERSWHPSPGVKDKGGIVKWRLGMAAGFSDHSGPKGMGLASPSLHKGMQKVAVGL